MKTLIDWSARRLWAVVLAAVFWVALERLGNATVGGFLPLTGGRLAVFLAGALLAQAAFAVVLGLAAGITTVLKTPSPWLGGLGWATIWALPMWWIGTEWSSGEWVAQQSWAAWVRPTVVAGGCLAALLVGWHWAKTRARPVPWGIAALVGAAALMLTDARLLSGLYPQTHLAEVVLAGVLSGLGWHRLLGRPWPIRLAIPAGVVALATVIGAGIVWTRGAEGARPGLMISSAVAENILPHLNGEQGAGLLRRALAQFDLSGTPPPTPTGAPIEGRDDWNLVFVLVDTLRADALAPNRGAGRPFAQPGDTPNIDAWMKTAVVFERAYSQASRTRYSMPALLRSLRPIDDFQHVGESVGRVMQARGRSAIAVLPQYFMVKLDAQVEGITDDFDAIAFYEKDDQSSLVPKAKRLIAESQGRPFFGWFHFYAPHLPGFDGRMLNKRDGSPIVRYRRSVRYLDGEFGKLMATLKAAGIADRTIIVLASDHGENLGEQGRFNHGGRVSEQEVRVPLAISVPGFTPPAEPIKATVSNIDIMPTLLDLVGAAPVTHYRGNSLRPLMQTPTAPWDHTYSVVNGNVSQHALVRGTQKWLLRRKQGTIQRFDVGIDPTETNDLHNPDDPIDRRFAVQALMRDSRLAKAELLADPAARQMVTATLQSLDGPAAAALGDGLDFLCTLVGLVPDDAALDAIERIFKQTTDPARLQIVRRLYTKQPKRIGRLLIDRLGAATPTEETALLIGLRRQGQVLFALAFMTERFERALVDGALPRVRAWLGVFAQWTLPRRRFVAPLGTALTRMTQADATPADLRLALETIGQLALRPKPNADAQALAQRLTTHLTHADAGVRAAAAKALARLRVKATFVPLRDALLKESSPLVQRALMQAIAPIGGPEAATALVQAGQDSLLSIEAAQLLRTLGADAEAALPYLIEQSKSHSTGFGRREASRARKAVQKAVSARAKAAP